MFPLKEVSFLQLLFFSTHIAYLRFSCKLQIFANCGAISLIGATYIRYRMTTEIMFVRYSGGFFVIFSALDLLTPELFHLEGSLHFLLLSCYYQNNYNYLRRWKCQICLYQLM